MTLTGMLADLPLLDLLRIVQTTQQTGHLHLITPAAAAEVVLMGGEAVHALIQPAVPTQLPCSGEDAFTALLQWREGTFILHPLRDAMAFPQTISRPTSALIRETLHMDVGVATHDQVTLQTPLRPAQSMLGTSERITLQREEWSVLTLICAQCTPKQICGMTGWSEGQVLQYVQRLITLGLVIPMPLAGLPQRTLHIVVPDVGDQRPTTAVPTAYIARSIRAGLYQY